MVMAQYAGRYPLPLKLDSFFRCRVSDQLHGSLLIGKEKYTHVLRDDGHFFQLVTICYHLTVLLIFSDVIGYASLLDQSLTCMLCPAFFEIFHILFRQEQGQLHAILFLHRKEYPAR